MSSIITNLLQDWLPAWLTQPPATPPPPIPDNVYHPQNAHEVYHVAFILRQLLIPDLIPPILDLAEYWTKSSEERQDPQSYVESTAGRPYLTIAVSSASGPCMVRKVELSITSRDQGWSDYRQYHGTYEGSWTWFEAEIRSPASSEGSDHVRRRLCSNVHAGRENKTHVIEWMYDTDDEEEKNLLRSLGPGSLISVVPWARFPGWKNHVSSASVVVYSAAVRRL